MLSKPVVAFLPVAVSSVAAGQTSAAASSSALAVRSHLRFSDFFAPDPLILPDAGRASASGSHGLGGSRRRSIPV